MRSFLLTLVAFAPFLAISQDQDIYYYHPQSIFELGAGFSKDNYSRLYARKALEYQQRTDTPVSVSSSLSTYVFYDANSLIDKFHLDSKVEARALVFNGSAEFNLDLNSTFESNSITIGVMANEEYGGIRMQNPKLIPEAQKLIDEGNFAAFRRQFGTHFVSQESRGIYLYVLITIENTSRSYQDKYGIHTQGSVDVGPIGGSFSLDINKEIQQAANTGKIKVQVAARGGGGLAGLKDLVTANFNLHPSIDAIANTLKDYIGKFRYKDAAPIAFNTSSFDQFGLIFDDIWDNQREDLIESIAKEYKNLDRYDKIIDNLLDPSINKYYLLDSTQHHLLDSISPLVKARKQTLADRHLQLRRGDSIATIHVGTPLRFDFARIIPTFPTFKVFCDCHVPPSNGQGEGADLGHGGDFPTILQFGNPNGSPTHFSIMSNLNIPENLKIIKNVQLLCNDSLLIDYSNDVANNGTGFQINCNNIHNGLYSHDFSHETPKSTTSFDEILGRFESAQYVAFTANSSQMEKILLYKVKVIDIFDNVESVDLSRLVFKKITFGNQPYREILCYCQRDITSQSIKVSFDNSVTSVTDSLYIFLAPVLTDNSPIPDIPNQLFNKKAGFKISSNTDKTTVSFPRIPWIKQVIVYWGFKNNDIILNDQNKVVHSRYKMVVDIPQRPFSPELDVVFKPI